MGHQEETAHRIRALACCFLGLCTHRICPSDPRGTDRGTSQLQVFSQGRSSMSNQYNHLRDRRGVSIDLKVVSRCFKYLLSFDLPGARCPGVNMAKAFMIHCFLGRSSVMFSLPSGKFYVFLNVGKIGCIVERVVSGSQCKVQKRSREPLHDEGSTVEGRKSYPSTFQYDPTSVLQLYNGSLCPTMSCFIYPEDSCS